MSRAVYGCMCRRGALYSAARAASASASAAARAASASASDRNSDPNAARTGYRACYRAGYRAKFRNGCSAKLNAPVGRTAANARSRLSCIVFCNVGIYFQTDHAT